MAKKDLYYWALIPEEPHLSQLKKLKKSVAVEYNTQKALTSPPHITILPPKHLSEDMKEGLVSRLEEICEQTQPFEIQLRDYGRFKQSVLFIAVELNENLSAFYEKCRKVYDHYNLKIRHDEFHPHMTIAFKDIKPKQFQRAWDRLKDEPFRLRFPANDLYGLEHDGKKWNVKEVLPLKRT